jgi:6-phosphogluconolactonase
MALGEGKARALQRVFTDPADPVRTPAQILQTCAARVTWLVDAGAAGLLPA